MRRCSNSSPRPAPSTTWPPIASSTGATSTMSSPTRSSAAAPFCTCSACSTGAKRSQSDRAPTSGRDGVPMERGHRASFQCTYHGWTFGLDGSLKGVPYPGGFDRSKGALGLDRPGQVDAYRGFVFANVSGEAPPLAVHLGAGGTELLDRLCDLSP